MSSFDTEIQQLQAKLALLEERKAVEVAKQEEQRANPMKTLEEFVDNLKQAIERERHSSSKFASERRIKNNATLVMLEPIVLALQELHRRMDALETK